MKIHIATMKWPYDRSVLAASKNKKRAIDIGWQKVKDENLVDIKCGSGAWARLKSDIEVITLEIV